LTDYEFYGCSSPAGITIPNRATSIGDYRPYLELGLALLLWRKGEAEIVDGVHEVQAANEGPRQGAGARPAG
jgi:hypothetical protein